MIQLKDIDFDEIEPVPGFNATQRVAQRLPMSFIYEAIAAVGGPYPKYIDHTTPLGNRVVGRITRTRSSFFIDTIINPDDD